MKQIIQTDSLSAFSKEYDLELVRKIDHLYLLNKTRKFIIDIFQEKFDKSASVIVYDVDNKRFSTLNRMIAASESKTEIIEAYKKQKAQDNNEVNARLTILGSFFAAEIFEKQILSKDISEAGSPQMIQRFEMVTSKKKVYYKITVSHDKQEMGVGFPQMDNFANKKGLDKDFYDKYMASYLDPLEGKLDFDNFLIKGDARLTDFVSSRFLSLNGFFVGTRVKDMISTHKTLNVTFIDSSATYKNDQVDLYFLQVIQSDIIDYSQSNFVTRKTLTDKIQDQLSFKNGEERIAYSRGLILNGSPFRLYPHKIKLEKEVDLFKMPSSNDYLISEKLLVELKLNDVSGFHEAKTKYTLA